MPRFYRSFLALFVALSLPLLGLGVFLAPDTSDLNRRPNQFPALEPARLADVEYYRQISDALGDRILARAFWRSLDATIDYRIFADAPNPRVTVGLDDWLFYEPALDVETRPDFEPQNVAGAVERIIGWGAQQGAETYYTFAPNKATLYSEYLRPVDLERHKMGASRLASVRAQLSKQERFIDLWDVLQRAKSDRPPKALLYYPRDTHWNGSGASLAAGAIIETISPGLWNPDAVRIVRTEAGRQDLDRVAGLWRQSERPRTVARRRGVTLELVRTGKPGERFVRIWRASSSEEQPLIDRKLVLIHDSFGTALHQMLPHYFEESAAVHINGVHTPAAEAAIQDADIVVVLMVERSMYRIDPETPMPPAKRARDLQRLFQAISRSENEKDGPASEG